MEGLTNYITIFKNLRHKAENLYTSCLSLANLLDNESIRLNRQEKVLRLKALHQSIMEQLDQAKRSEDAARYGHSQAKMVSSWVGLAVGIVIQKASKDKKLLAFSNHLLNNLGGKESPFGKILVCIGPKGLPDDVGITSISKLARESNYQEAEVINDLKEHGYLILSKDVFSRLIEKIIKDINEGIIDLPIPIEKLPEITTSSKIKLILKTKE